MKPILISLIVFTTTVALGQNGETTAITYLKQSPPGLVPQVFAPEIVSKKNEYEFGSVFSADRKEFYYAVTIDG